MKNKNMNIKKIRIWLKEKVAEARQLMEWHKPNKDAMGTMYYYWKEKRDEALREIREMKN